MSDIGKLNDNAFNVASSALREISEAIEAELGRKPTLEELCEVLTEGFRCSGKGVVSDIDPGRIDRVSCRVRRAKIQKLSPGDLVAVPGAGDKYYLGIYITKNRFGHAFGFFRGRWPCRRLAANSTVEPCGAPVFTSLHAVWNGTWRVLDQRPDLLSHFDHDPEYYHAKSDHPWNSEIGEFGSAERASNELRSIGRDEAARVGLLDGSYRGVQLPEDVADRLAKRGC